MSDIDVEQRLNDAGAAWDKAEAENPNAPLPDGEYQASVNRFDFHEAKKDQALLLRTEFSVIAPADYSGRRVSTFHNLENPEQMGWTKAHLEMLGVENISPLNTIEDRLAEALDKVCEIALASKQVKDKTYQNVYLNGVLHDVKVEDENPDGGAEQAPPPDDDDIPF